jgi:hypothetical protein
MHLSRLCAVLIDCRTSDLDGATRFWSEALGRSMDPNHPGSRGNYRMLETPPDEPIVQINTSKRLGACSKMRLFLRTHLLPSCFAP